MPRVLEGRSILVVEDEPLIALDITEVLESAGAVVLTTYTLEHALHAVERPGIAGAVVDLSLQGGTTSPVCERLRTRGIPFMVYSGAPADGPCAGPHLRKPATPSQLVSAMSDLLR